MDNKKIRIGIIAEYNPFHNGHIYQINEIKKRWPNSKIIVSMSGKYVQRGQLAITTFEQRKKIALENGVNEVYELPFEYATQAAHIFAQGAIKQLNEHKINLLVFGSETNQIDDFYLIAKAIKDNEKYYYELISHFMGNRWGNSGNSVRLYFLGSKITADGDCSHEIKRRLLLGDKRLPQSKYQYPFLQN